VAEVDLRRELPHCELLQQLDQKARLRSDIPFNLIGKLEDFREEVVGEVRQINELFPEYTPHDDEYHLKRLFHIADTLLGKDLMQEMNSAELLLLAVGLYGHDWGMAVSEAEKELILTGEVPEGRSRQEFCLLAQESGRLLRFARDSRLELDEDGRPYPMPIESWREYVRLTHAERSAERVRRFFEHIDGSLANAGARVCLGHSVGLEELGDFRSYRVSFPVLREPANLQAVAIYVRLVDLFDIGEDRTPYVVWKFVAPRDPRSRMEWEKHRALYPMTCSPYGQGRAVQVYGSTDDHEVFAALEDLHLYCDKQLRGCSDLLARMRDSRYYLDIVQLDWKVEARGFSPVSMQFEFDRDMMFELLSDELYQGDPYVFLRELLQNSIDAIRMRREVLERSGPGAGDVGVIRVTVDHDQKGDATVTWQDDGVGMDVRIARDYLAVVGKSYYRSADFERENLAMDPISRFGFGMLSCFMVADEVQIDTYREPSLATDGESDPLTISIADMRRQFRIEKRPKEGAHPGTVVRVFVSGKKLPTDEGGTVQPLDVTEYLSVVAGFVEFPILITEGNRKTIILRPGEDAAAARSRLEEMAVDCEVRQLELGYPWSEAIVPQDVPIASELLREESWRLADDLQLEGYDGVLTYLVPRDERGDVVHSVGYGDEVMSYLWVRGEDGIPKEERVRWLRQDPGDDVPATGLSPSCSHAGSLAVYRDGILLASAPAPSAWLRDNVDPLPPARCVVNLPKSAAPRIDLSRSAPIAQDQPWDAAIFQAHLARLCEVYLDDLLALEPDTRLYQLGRLAAFHRIPVQDLWSSFPHDLWPIALLDPEGVLQVVNWEDVAPGIIYSVPGFLRQQSDELATRRWLRQEEYDGPLLQWRGERCEAMTALGGFLPAGLRACTVMFYVAASGRYVSDGCRFLSGPWGDEPPVLQWFWRPVGQQEVPAVEDILDRAARNPTGLSSTERLVLQSVLAEDYPFLLVRWAEFPAPFDKYFGYAYRVLNVSHPATVALVRLMAAIRLARARRTLLPQEIGQLTDNLQEALRMLGSALAAPRSWSGALEALWATAGHYGLLEAAPAEQPVPCPDEFVPGIERLGTLERGWAESGDVHPFGEPLS